MSSAQPSRRAVVRTAAWTVPAVTVAAAAPAFAGTAPSVEVTAVVVCRHNAGGSRKGLNAAAHFTNTGTTSVTVCFVSADLTVGSNGAGTTISASPTCVSIAAGATATITVTYNNVNGSASSYEGTIYYNVNGGATIAEPWTQPGQPSIC